MGVEHASGDPSIYEEDDVLAGFRLWVLKTAWEYARNEEDASDLSQEAWIAMWRALRGPKPANVALHTHLMNKARWRIIECVTRGQVTGQESRKGRKHTAGTARNKGREIATDVTVEHDGWADTDLDLEAVVWAYHNGEILDAINTLPMQQRERVIAWFWRGEYPDPKNRSWWDAKRIGAKDRLRDELWHLEKDW